MPEPLQWEYKTGTNRYRNTTNGRFVSERDVLNIRDRIVGSAAGQMDGLADRYIRGGINVSQWEAEGRAIIQDITTVQFAFGRGGINAITQADRAILEGIIDSQWSYWSGFADDLAAGRVSEAQLANRAKMYIEATTAAFEQGRATAWNLDLPAHPGDGQTRCLVRCKCHWLIGRRKGKPIATWVLEPAAEHCIDCIYNAQRWSPFTGAAEAA